MTTTTTTAAAVPHPSHPPRTLRAYLKGPPKVSQAALARRLGVTQSMISLVVRGVRQPRAYLVLKLHRATRISLQDLLHPPRTRARRRQMSQKSRRRSSR